MEKDNTKVDLIEKVQEQTWKVLIAEVQPFYKVINNCGKPRLYRFAQKVKVTVKRFFTTVKSWNTFAKACMWIGIAAGVLAAVFAGVAAAATSVITWAVISATFSCLGALAALGGGIAAAKITTLELTDLQIARLPAILDNLVGIETDYVNANDPQHVQDSILRIRQLMNITNVNIIPFNRNQNQNSNQNQNQNVNLNLNQNLNQNYNQNPNQNLNQNQYQIVNRNPNQNP